MIDGLGSNLKPLATFVTLDRPGISHFRPIFFVTMGANGAGITCYGSRQVQLDHAGKASFVRLVHTLCRMTGRRSVAVDTASGLFFSLAVSAQPDGTRTEYSGLPFSPFSSARHCALVAARRPVILDHATRLPRSTAMPRAGPRE